MAHPWEAMVSPLCISISRENMFFFQDSFDKGILTGTKLGLNLTNNLIKRFGTRATTTQHTS